MNKRSSSNKRSAPLRKRQPARYQMREYVSTFDRGLCSQLQLILKQQDLTLEHTKPLIEFIDGERVDEIAASTIGLIEVTMPRLFTALPRDELAGAALSLAIVRLHAIATRKPAPMNGASEKMLASIANHYGIRYLLHVEYAREADKSFLVVDVQNRLPSPISSDRHVELAGGVEGEMLYVTLERVGDGNTIDRVLYEELTLDDELHRFPIPSGAATDDLTLSIASNGTPIVRAKLRELA